MRLILFSFLVLIGCASQEEIDAANAARAHEYWQGIAGSCTDMGYAQDTPEFKSCMFSVNQQQQANNAALAGAILGNMQRPVAPMQPYMTPVPRMTQTNCFEYGNNLNCTSSGAR